MSLRDCSPTCTSPITACRSHGNTPYARGWAGPAAGGLQLDYTRLHAGWEAVLSAVGYTGHARSCASDVRSRVKRSLSVERDQSLRTVDGLSSHQRIGARVTDKDDAEL